MQLHLAEGDDFLFMFKEYGGMELLSHSFVTAFQSVKQGVKRKGKAGAA